MSQPDYRVLLRKYMTLVKYANNGRSFLDLRSDYFQTMAEIGDEELRALAVVDRSIPQMPSDPDFETDEDESSASCDEIGRAIDDATEASLKR
ncbi:hypothetical protein OIU34_11720 [Pararhizobium sp. BT-229]|uniref:hypothetical protein n=1 Tax=Pararhizobium sp. BT-229 TaxID=2986923 RepID=UPI0021F6A076|nr:hypothetical protein [Pararhizobium sp. BT-229]MCV9962567.1 hypothetical protein [Pararhizobium sp. BT-229]